VLIMVANEPRVYREALAAALRLRRPEDEILVVEPEHVEEEVKRFEPEAVISSRPSPGLASRDSWMLLYPRFEDEAVLDVSGQAMLISMPDLALVLAFLTMVSAKAGDRSS
jgi:hypothetical protein